MKQMLDDSGLLDVVHGSGGYLKVVRRKAKTGIWRHV